MKRILLLVVAVAALLAATPAVARSAVPCRDEIYNQWYASGKISTTYPLTCYGDALKHIPTDAQVYSNLGSDIQRALQAAELRKTDPSSVPALVGSGSTATGPHGADAAVVVYPHGHPPAVGVASVAAQDVSGGSSGLPLPILVLGGLALAMAGAGAIGFGVRHFKR